MLKNTVIIVLIALLVVMIYKHLAVHDNIKTEEKQGAVNVNGDTGIMNLYKESEKIFSVISNDEKFVFLFVYDENGLQTFSIQDSLTDKLIAFNISNEGTLVSYTYEDERYIVRTNIETMGTDQIIQREEWYNGYATIYELFHDGSTNLTLRDAGLGRW